MQMNAKKWVKKFETVMNSFHLIPPLSWQHMLYQKQLLRNHQPMYDRDGEMGCQMTKNNELLSHLPFVGSC